MIKFDFFLNTNKMAKRFSITYIFTGLLGVIFLDKFIKIYLENNSISLNSIFTFNIFFIISTGIIIYLTINHMQKVIKKCRRSLQ